MRPALTEQALVRRRDAIDLTGKRILLTGASSGIGEAAAEKFARCGATVVVVARRRELLDTVVERITAAGGAARAHVCDLSDLDVVDKLVATVEHDLGGVDILINNAGNRSVAHWPSHWIAGTTSSAP
jgi:NAD(P)-dependent dehydrogenase (short-subunit alcohol dehydrogenase family)